MNRPEYFNLFRRGRCLPAALAVFAVLAAGCTSTRLTPAPGARTVAPQTAVDNVDGVRVTVAANAWTGTPTILSHVTPLKVSIRNDSSRPLAIRYDQLALVGPDGARYNALPPFFAEAVAHGVSPIHPIGFVHHRFHVAPHLHAYYPGLSALDDPWFYDSFYDRHYYGYWSRHNLVLDELRRQAIPPGVLSPGGEVSGFLYFEKVPADVGDEVAFRGDLINSRTGEVFGTIRVPFQVEEVTSS